MPYSHCGCATMIEPGLRSRNLRCGQALMNISVPTVGMGGTSDEGYAGKRKCERTILVSCQRHLHLASPLVAIGPSVELSGARLFCAPLMNVSMKRTSLLHHRCHEFSSKR